MVYRKSGEKFFETKKEKIIPDGKYRIIKIGKDALYEILRVYIIDNEELFFDISDRTKIVKCFEMDWNKGELVCVARNEYGENEHLQFDIDMKKLILKLHNTTETMYADNRYIEVSEEEIKNL